MSTTSHDEGQESRDPGREFVQVAYGNDPLEAKMIQGLLESEGIPAMVGRRGMDGPMYGYGSLRAGFDGGGRRVMVPAARVEEAKALLAKTLAANEGEEIPESANSRFLDQATGARAPRNYGLVGGYARIYLWSFVALAFAFGVFLLLRAL